MATLYGKGKGKARSHAPLLKEKPPWIKLTEEEIQDLVVDLGKKGIMPARIGLILRDSYGIPSVKAILGKKICHILKKRGIEVKNENLLSLEKKKERLLKHLEKNKKDKVAKRGLQLTVSKITRLRRYLKKGKKGKSKES